MTQEDGGRERATNLKRRHRSTRIARRRVGQRQTCDYYFEECIGVYVMNWDEEKKTRFHAEARAKRNLESTTPCSPRESPSVYGGCEQLPRRFQQPVKTVSNPTGLNHARITRKNRDQTNQSSASALKGSMNTDDQNLPLRQDPS